MPQDASLDAVKRSWRNELQKLHTAWIEAEKKRRLAWVQDKHAEILRLQHEHQTETSAMLDSCKDERSRAELQAAAERHMKGLQALLDQVDVSLPFAPQHEEAPAVVYVLQCEHDKFYVGRCVQRRRAVRMQEHRGMKSDLKDLLHGSEWTRRHRFVRVLEEKPCWDYLQENMTVLQWMRDKGIDNVRGGPWPMCELGHWRAEIERQLDNAMDACFHCHSMSHFAAECPSKTQRHRTPPRPAADPAAAKSCPPFSVDPAGLPSATAAVAEAYHKLHPTSPPPKPSTAAAAPAEIARAPQHSRVIPTHSLPLSAGKSPHEMHPTNPSPRPKPSTAPAAATSTPSHSHVSPPHLLPPPAATPPPTPHYKPCGWSPVHISSTWQPAPPANTTVCTGACVAPPPRSSLPTQPPQPPHLQEQADIDASAASAAAAAAVPSVINASASDAAAAAAVPDAANSGPSYCTASTTKSTSSARKRGRELSTACDAQAAPALLCMRLAQLSTGDHATSTARAAGGSSTREPVQPWTTTSSHSHSRAHNNSYTCAQTALRASCNASPTKPCQAPVHARWPPTSLTSGGDSSTSSGLGLPKNESARPLSATNPVVLQPWGSNCEGEGGITGNKLLQAQPSLMPAQQPATAAPLPPLTHGSISISSTSDGLGLPRNASARPSSATNPAVLQPGGSSCAGRGGGITASPTLQAQPSLLPNQRAHTAPLAQAHLHHTLPHHKAVQAHQTHRQQQQQQQQAPTQAPVRATPPQPPCSRCGRSGHTMLYDSHVDTYVYDCWSKTHCVTQQLLPAGHHRVPLS